MCQNIEKEQDLGQTIVVPEKERNIHCSERSITDLPDKTTEGGAVPSGNKENSAPPVIDEVDLAGKLGEMPDNGGIRYECRYLLGRGRTGSVYNVYDHDFQRDVAAKFLEHSQQERERYRFLSEARLTANLEHPNILPVYNIGVDSQQHLFYTMKEVTGTSLEEVIRLSQKKQEIKGIDTRRVNTLNEKIRVFLRICNALSYAHNKGIVHQDVKPANIMLGKFGEVHLVDWGIAVNIHEQQKTSGLVMGTPAFMSPEQARGEPVDKRSDVFCLGASLFYTIFNRYPTLAKTRPRLLKKRAQGIINHPNKVEMQGVPKVLLAICCKAMAVKPEDRYSSVGAFARELKKYQNGLTVSAYKYSIVERLVQWYRRNRQFFWSMLIIFILLVGSVGLIFWQWYQERAGWGRPIVTERFTDDEWRSRWRVIEGAFQRKEGRLVSQNDNASILLFHRRLLGSTALEFEGEVLPGERLGDLSVVWHEDGGRGESRPLEKNGQLIYFQTGGMSNTLARIHLPDTLAYSPFVLQREVRYRIRVEIDADRLRLLVNNREILSHKTLFPLRSGFIAIYAYYPGKAFDNIRIYQKLLPRKVSVMELADRYYRDDLFGQAAAIYDKIEVSHPDTRLAEEARYKRGLCRWRQHRRTEAKEIWGSLRKGDYYGYVSIYKMKEAFRQGNHKWVRRHIKELYPQSSLQVRQKIGDVWAGFLRSLNRHQDRDVINRYLSLRNAVFPRDWAYDYVSANTLLKLRRYETVLNDYPSQKSLAAEALYKQKRYREVIKRYPGQPLVVIRALSQLGRLKEAKRRYPAWGKHISRLQKKKSRQE